MVVTLEPLFIEHFQKCTLYFQEQFRKSYQLLKIAEHPLEIKSVIASIGNAKRFKSLIDKGRISLNLDDGILKIVCFLYNQFHNKEE